MKTGRFSPRPAAFVCDRKEMQMPYVNLKVAGKLTRQQKEQIAKEFADTLLKRIENSVRKSPAVYRFRARHAHNRAHVALLHFDLKN